MDKVDKFSEEQLNAFVDGELDSDEKSRVYWTSHSAPKNWTNDCVSNAS